MGKKPQILVFAGPNGSGKSTVTKFIDTVGVYINADEIRKTNHCTDLEAAVMAEDFRNAMMNDKKDFTFETVMSTDRNLKLLQKAKDNGYFIKCIYVLTCNSEINVIRVKSRVASGGHDVPEQKILSRYEKALCLVPEILKICDICHIYDNTDVPFRIFKKKREEVFMWENAFWSIDKINHLVTHNIQALEFGVKV